MTTLDEATDVLEKAINEGNKMDATKRKEASKVENQGKAGLKTPKPSKKQVKESELGLNCKQL